MLLQVIDTLASADGGLNTSNLLLLIGGIGGSVAAVLTPFLTFYQHTQNKKADLKYQQTLKDIEAKQQAAERVYDEKSIKRSNAYGKIYGKLWKQLNALDCDRVSIIQPHPLNRKQFLSVSIGICRDGISSIKDTFNNLSMERVPQFVGELEGRDFIFYKKMRTETKDKVATALFASCGCKSMVIKRMVDEEEAWIGNIICEWCRETSTYPDFAKGQLSETAMDIQYILPEYDERFKNE